MLASWASDCGNLLARKTIRHGFCRAVMKVWLSHVKPQSHIQVKQYLEDLFPEQQRWLLPHCLPIQWYSQSGRPGLQWKLSECRSWRWRQQSRPIHSRCRWEGRGQRAASRTPSSSASCSHHRTARTVHHCHRQRYHSLSGHRGTAPAKKRCPQQVPGSLSPATYPLCSWTLCSLQW